jgi:hypothetical protein
MSAYGGFVLKAELFAMIGMTFAPTDLGRCQSTESLLGVHRQPVPQLEE